MRPFDLFVGVDWSGAKTRRLKGLQIAMAESGDSSPKLVCNPMGARWTRADFVDWLIKLQSHDNRRILCGLDFSFGFPYGDNGGYFPGVSGQPGYAIDLWATVQKICAEDQHLGAGSFVTTPGFADHFYVSGSGRGRFRLAEQACAAAGYGTPECMFKLVGPTQVAKSSLTGMRALAALRQRANDVAVWPFEPPDDAQLVIVEVFPTSFVRMAKEGVGKVRDVQRLNRVLRNFDSASFSPLMSSLTDDMTDALITSAALRRLSSCDKLWKPSGLSNTTVRLQEGWIFGVL